MCSRYQGGEYGGGSIFEQGQRMTETVVRVPKFDGFEGMHTNKQTNKKNDLQNLNPYFFRYFYAVSFFFNLIVFEFVFLYPMRNQR